MKYSSSLSRIGLWAIALVALFVGVLAWENASTAQDGQGADAQNVDAAEADAGDPTGDEPESFGMMIVNSGWFGWIFYIALGIFSIVGLMVAMERLINLRKGAIAPTSFLTRVTDIGARADATPSELVELAKSSATPAGRVLRAGAMRAGRPVVEVEKAMEDAAIRETAELRSRNRPLSVVGNIAPLVGLLGTVVGMIFAFQSAEGGLGTGGNAGELAAGIKLALITTAAGLTIAVPAMLLSAWFNSRVDKFMRQIAAAVGDTIPLFTRLETNTQAIPPREELVG